MIDAPALERAKSLIGQTVRLSPKGPITTVSGAYMADYIDPASCPEKSNNLEVFLDFENGHSCLYTDFLHWGVKL